MKRNSEILHNLLFVVRYLSVAFAVIVAIVSSTFAKYPWSGFGVILGCVFVAILSAWGERRLKA